MITLKYNCKNVYPEKDFCGLTEITCSVSNEAYKLAKQICDEYGCNIGEICALIEFVELENWKRDEMKKRNSFSKAKTENESIHWRELPDNSKVLVKSNKISQIQSIVINTNVGAFKLDYGQDPYLFDLILKRHTPAQSNITTSFASIIIKLFVYFEYHTKVRPTPTNVIIGLICHYCKVYPDTGKPLLSENEFNNSELEYDTYKAYLHSTVKTWKRNYYLTI